MAHYDYIILGAGAAGLMLARAMAADPWFHTKSILLIDKDQKDKNDRTWCFWEEGEGSFDHLLSRRWEHIYFRSSNINKRLPIAPYSYKMLRAKDFYRDHLDVINRAPNIELLQDTIEKIEENDAVVSVTTTAKTITANVAFNGLFNYKTLMGQEKYPVLQQHFIGWFVKTSEPVFDSAAATFMDFSVPQKGNTRFMYVLPFSETEALVEYTLFSDTPLEDDEYEKAILNYLQDDLNIKDYTVLEKEKGNIPMTCYNFEARNTDRCINIGTAGGWAKPSTGYAFKNTYKNTQSLIQFLKEEKPFRQFTTKRRHWYYDLLLLDILDRNNELGSSIFESLFKRRNTDLILRFLDEETTILQDLKVITGCPFLPFTRALIGRLIP